jgi:hypothetical protein
MNKFAAFLAFMGLNVIARAQADVPEMADSQHESGKIYVVIGVIVIIFVSILVFLLFIERRLARLERSMGAKNSRENS